MGGGDGYKTVAYFVNWAIYGRNHHAQHLPAEYLTHILYSFANVRPENGEVYLTDTWSDIEKHYPTDSWNDVGHNLYGSLKQLYLLKKAHPHLKVLLSIGGWTYSSNFTAPCATPQGRQTFARTATALVSDLGLDGLDIDWEYPQNPEQGGHFLALLQACRTELDALSARYRDAGNPTAPGAGRPAAEPRFLLTIAAPAGAQNYQHLPLREVGATCDFINLMAYDYAGSWDQNAGHQAALFPSDAEPASTPFNTDKAIADYLAAGVPPHKMVMGLPLYGRAFENTDGPGKPFQGVGEGSWEKGVWDWKKLPLAGSEVREDRDRGWSYGYDAGKRTMVSFDTTEIARRKMEYVKEKQLGGAMWWESSADKEPGKGSMIEAVAQQLGAIDRTENCVSYPFSSYENLKKGMDGEEAKPFPRDAPQQ